MAARATVLATGGGAALWARTTNPWGRSRRARCSRTPPGPTWPISSSASSTRPRWHFPGSDHDGTLLTEALRGEGAALLDASGRRFTDELAPRDQLTIAILDRMDADGTDHVGLDLRGIDPASFPNVFAACHDAGLAAERSRSPSLPRPTT